MEAPSHGPASGNGGPVVGSGASPSQGAVGAPSPAPTAAPWAPGVELSHDTSPPSPDFMESSDVTAMQLTGSIVFFTPEEYLGPADKLSYLERLLLVQAGLMPAHCHSNTIVLHSLIVTPVICVFFMLVAATDVALLPPIVLFVQMVVKLVIVSVIAVPVLVFMAVRLYLIQHLVGVLACASVCGWTGSRMQWHRF